VPLAIVMSPVLSSRHPQDAMAWLSQSRSRTEAARKQKIDRWNTARVT
jgi:hypothetical protein